MKKHIHNTAHFLKHDVWRIPIKELSPARSFLIRQIRIFLLAAKGFTDDKIQLRASALSLYTLLSIVPILAMVFGIAKGFGLEKRVEDLLINNFTGQEEVLNFLIKFANQMLENTKGGFIAGVGLVVLFFAVMKVLGHVEAAFNNIWQVRQSRTFFRKFSDYFSLILIAPVLIFLSSSLSVFITTQLKGMAEAITFIGYFSKVITIIVNIIPYVITWLLFTFVYIIMPNTKVNYKSALVAGIIAGTAFQLVQLGYIHFQVLMSRYNTIYGSFAALPLFLIWLQISWFLVLFGAEISFANQNIERYEHESESLNISHYYRRILTLLIAKTVIQNFEQGNKPYTASEIAHKLGFPIRIVREILFELTDANIFNEIISDNIDKAFQPATDIHKITIRYIIETLDKKGHDDIEIEQTEELKKIAHTQATFFKAFEKTPENKLLKDI